MSEKIAYLLSFPERLIRAAAALVGGLLFETSQVLLPRWLRRSRLYQAIAYRLLRLTVELVGGVRDVFPQDEMKAQELLLRKSAGNVIELASILTVGWSPLWLLAATADLTGGTRIYLRALVSELQKQRLLPPDTELASVEELLHTLESSSALAADMVDVPPVNVSQLRQSWQTLQNNVGSLPDPNSLMEIYNQLQKIAQQEDRSLWLVSSSLAVGAVRAGVQLGSTYIFSYYQDAFKAISAEGWAAYAKRVVKPYVSAVADHFNPERQTYTEKALLHLNGLKARRMPGR